MQKDISVSVIISQKLLFLQSLPYRSVLVLQQCSEGHKAGLGLSVVSRCAPAFAGV